MTLNDITTLRRFAPVAQMRTLIENIRGEEGAYFRERITRLAGIINNMPVTYAQEGSGDSAIAYLHYFAGQCDWYITEKDIETDDEPGQHQAFGLASLGYEPELGYISIVELIHSGAELDLHFTPCSLGRIKASLEESDFAKALKAF